MVLPPSLNKGDLITIVAPSGKVNPEYVLRSKSVLESWGFRVELGKSVLNEYGRFAGTPQERLYDLQKALDNAENKAVFGARGGYGIVHLLENLSLKSFKKNPKWVIGYSDISALHAKINNTGICSLHAPMSSHLSEESKDDKASHYLKQILSGQFPTYEIEPHPLNRIGKITGILRGGNLSVLSSLRGTPYDFPASNTILFIEDVGEKPYHIERMMYNLKLSKVLQNISGLIIGQFSNCEEDPSMNKTIYKSIADLVADYNYPVCFNFSVGHVKDNYPLVCGKNTALQITENAVILN
ncbi:MAG: LD-carboxypeptidase [Candidatus Azobacteroides sp.]|nr:LD-carboxypeptidase [Candidatus Azobacteroides sp.]